MIDVPNILSNPFDPAYKLKDYEIYSLKECLELIQLQKYSYSLFALWNGSIINLQRRIEHFGIDNFLNIIDEKDQYHKEGNKLKDRWLSINEYKILEYAFKINIINHATLNLLITLYWMKSDTLEFDNSNLEENDIYAMAYLLERNLFLKEFKEDKRGKNPMQFGINLKFRRKEDIDKTDLNTIPNTYHNLMMRSGVQIFEEQNKQNNSNDNIIDKYC